MTVLEPRRWRSSTGGCMTSRPACRAKRLRLCVQHHKAGLATGTPAGDELKCLGITQEVVAHIAHGLKIDAVAPPGDEHARMYALERVKVRQVEEVSYPAVDAQQVERGRRDEVQRYGVGVKERAYVREAVQHAARLGPAGVHVHASRGDVVGCGPPQGQGRNGQRDAGELTCLHAIDCALPMAVVHLPMAVRNRGVPQRRTHQL